MKKGLSFIIVLLLFPVSIIAQIIVISTPGSKTSTTVMGGEYNVMNNVWGSGTGVGAQHVEVDTSSTYFRIILSEHNSSSVAAYPSIFKGNHWGWATTKYNPMPIRIDEIDSAPFTWIIDTAGVSGTYNCAYESWFSDSPTGTNYKAELMIWINYGGGAGPGGSKQDTVEIGGRAWEVYYALWDWNYIAYKLIVPTDNVNLDLKDFLRDALTRGYIYSTWYLHNMEAGFELWRGGQGLATLEYEATVVPGFFTDNFAPTPFNLVYPSNGRSLSKMAIPFRWQTSLDGNNDPVEYIFHLFGPNVDTTIAQLSDDSLYFDGTNCLNSYTYYTWEVKATDGIDTTTCGSQRNFRTPQVTGIALSGQIPDHFGLGQNYPNPFNPLTTISYSLPQASTVTLKVFDPTGCTIATPIDQERKEAGTYTVSFDASNLPSGVYFYRLQAGNFTSTKGMVVIK
jgi:cellulose 1,4-beta-cellobiosidase